MHLNRSNLHSHTTLQTMQCRAHSNDDQHASLFPDDLQAILRQRMATVRANEDRQVTQEALMRAQRAQRPNLPEDPPHLVDVSEAELRALAEWHEASWDLLRRQHSEGEDGIA